MEMADSGERGNAQKKVPGAQVFVHVFENACSYGIIESGLFDFAI